MIIILITIVVLIIILITINIIFSIMLCGKIVSCTSENFECGFYSITSSLMRYRYNYWMIIIHFIISEQESILSLLLIFGIHAFNTNNLLCLLLGLLFIDTFYYLSIIYSSITSHSLNITTHAIDIGMFTTML